MMAHDGAQCTADLARLLPACVLPTPWHGSAGGSLHEAVSKPAAAAPASGLQPTPWHGSAGGSLHAGPGCGTIHVANVLESHGWRNRLETTAVREGTK